MSAESITVAILAGGTGGHILPGLAVAEVLRRRGYRVTWLGSRGGLEQRMVPDAGIAFDAVNVSRLRGRGRLQWLLAPGRLLRAAIEAGGHLRRRRPACALCMGGFAAGPGGIAARLLGIPLVVHEQNRLPGMTNRWLARVARRVCQAFDDSFASRTGAVTTGNPVRRSIEDLPDPGERFAAREGTRRLLVLGGSQGARALNERLPGVLDKLAAHSSLRVVHQCGERWLEACREAYAGSAVTQANVVAFIDDMAAAYADADLVLARAGAMTVSELAAAGVGSVLVPFPHAVDDHQTRNAEVLATAGAALIVPEPELNSEALYRRLAALLDDREALLKMARAARRQACPRAAETIADICLEATS